jgi:hypothetical protein
VWCGPTQAGQTQVSNHILERQSSIGMAVPVWIGQK